MTRLAPQEVVSAGLWPTAYPNPKRIRNPFYITHFCWVLVSRVLVHRNDSASEPILSTSSARIDFIVSTTDQEC